MGNSASTEQQQQTKPTSTTSTDRPYNSPSYSSSSTDHQSRSSDSKQQQQKPTTQTPFQFSITEPTTTTTAAPTTFQPMTNPNTTTTGWTTSSSSSTPIDTTSAPKPVPGRSGWVSSTGASSPWYGGGSLSSSASSSHYQQQQQQLQQQQQRSHRQSISGPYYRARGMSINQQQEPNEEDLLSSSYSSQQPTPKQTNLQQPSPSVSTSQQPPRLQMQQLQLNSTSPSSPISSNKLGTSPKEKQDTTTGVPTIITWSQGGNNVYVTGTFNGWKHKIKLIQSTHDFSTVLDLPLGTHRLKFIVDDEWKCSNDMETATDPDGNLVNYLQVIDENDMEEDMMDGGLATPTEEYTSMIPKELLLLSEAMQEDNDVMDSQQKRAILEWERKLPQPPTLPPHLEKVMLNAQAVSDEDNSVLPVPNHVTLNHLYACSIKDHVMALATTTRYRKKYVTTMYYRPVQ